MAKGTFACAINCMDGRVQVPLYEYIKNKYAVDYVDMVTEPGPVKILAENSNQSLIDSIKVRLEISSKMHHANAVVIAAHIDCAGNPVAKEIQLEQLSKAGETVSAWNLFDTIELVWINENWEAETL